MVWKSGGKLEVVIRYGMLLLTMGGAAVGLSGSGDGTFKAGGVGRSIAYIPNETYEKECTPCHLGFLPGFLPQRSWILMMNGLEDHFGENAALDEGPRREILQYLLTHAADQSSSTLRSKKIAALIPKDETPLRITETAFWMRRHGSVREWVWKRPTIGTKAKCQACHREGEKGIFDEHDVRIPRS